MADFGQEIAESRLYEGPGTLILWLFLNPLNLSVLVTIQGRLDRAEGEWSQLFDSNDRDIFDSSLCTLLLEFVIDLSAAVKDLLDLVICNEVSGRIFKNMLESKPCFKFFYVAPCTSKFEKLFRDRNNKRLAEWSTNLTSKKMEVLSGCGAIAKRKVHVLCYHSIRVIVFRRHIVAITKL